MENEQVDRKTMTLKDLLMTIPREDIEKQIENNISPELLGQASVEVIADSIEKVLASPDGVFVNKAVEFASIYSLLEEQIPADEEDGEIKKFGLNMLSGDKDLKIINEQVCKIFQDLNNAVPDQNFSANILSSAFIRAYALQPLQKILFIENYKDLPFDVRQNLRWLPERGIKLIISSENNEIRPFDMFATYGNGYQESDCLKNGLEKVPQLRISEKQEKKEEKVA